MGATNANEPGLEGVDAIAFVVDMLERDRSTRTKLAIESVPLLASGTEVIELTRGKNDIGLTANKCRVKFKISY